MPVSSRVLMTSVLGLTFAATACARPAPTAVAHTPTPSAPTAVPQTSSDAIVRFFAHASEPACASSEDQLEYTTHTVRCTFTDRGVPYIVEYNEWFSEPAWWDGMNQLRAFKDVLVDEAWTDMEDEALHGMYIAWIELGQVVLMWGVDGRPLSGTLYWHDTNPGTAIHAFDTHARAAWPD